MKKILFIFVIIGCTLTNVFSQENTNQSVFSNQNTIYGTVALGGFWGTLNINYERQLMTTNNRIFKTFGVRIGGGYWATWGQQGSHYIITPTFLSGTGNNHFESAIGATLLYDKLSYDIGVSNAEYFNEPIPSHIQYMDIYPAGSLGYRYQKPDGWLMFRTGIGFPDVVYLGLGVVF
ncbi:MAG: hypothetical protein AB8G11_23105 [Saprospiraceae bacterium]